VVCYGGDRGGRGPTEEVRCCGQVSGVVRVKVDLFT